MEFYFTGGMPMATYTILIPLDGSNFSRRVIPYVLHLFDPQHHELVLVRVGDEPKSFPVTPTQPLFTPGLFLGEMRLPTSEQVAEYQVYASQLREATLATLTDELHEDAHEFEQAGYTVTTEVRFGDPAQEICAYANHHPIDFVVMATHGRTGLRRLALGSVATEVLQYIAIPVMFVPPDKEALGDHGDALLN
jgi:nucleotide-binding universal stress UspA family protein